MAKRRMNGRGKSGGSGGLIAGGVAVVVALVIGFVLMGGADDEQPVKRRRRAKKKPATATTEPAAKPEAPTRPAAKPDVIAKTSEPVKAELVPDQTPEVAPEPIEPAAPPADFEVKEPASVAAVTVRKPERDRWSWNAPHAKVGATGDLTWQPEKFSFKPEGNVRYIDYERGRDTNGGTSKSAAWKHHPWDPEAGGAAAGAKGPATYVFKRGVVYRGRLVCKEAGTPERPIQLTSDPRWGRGEAVISGAERISNWSRGGHDKMPDKSKVWYADVNWLVRNAWVTDRAGNIVRLNLARSPNWKVSDPEDVMSEWWEWEQPNWWEHKNKATVNGRRMHLGIDKKHLTESADHYQGAVVRTEWGIVMGTPFPTRVEMYDAQKKGVAFQGVWFGDSATLITRNRYYIEDKPHFLDEAGEFWVEKKGGGCRVYVRMPKDASPANLKVDVARHYNLIQDMASEKRPVRLDILGADKKANLNTTGMKHVRISGLTFRFTNTVFTLEHPQWMHRDVDNAAIRLYGSCDGAEIVNCKFEHVAKAVHITGIDGRTHTGRVVVADNEMSHIDHGAITISKSGGSLRDVHVLRNKLFMIGLRPYRQSHGHALSVNWADRLHLAGNILDRCYGAGLFLFGGKGSGATGDAPMCRMVVHNNKATNTLLAANDWGGIETWQGGPCYVYNNISGNANGYWNWAYNKDKPGGARLGFAYYLDGGFKNYLFNNIAWGISNDLTSKHCSHTAFYHAQPTIYNSYFGNTAYLFAQGSAWSPAGGRNIRLGNVFSDISMKVFAHGKQKEDAKAVYKKYPLETVAYGRNVFYAVPQKFGLLEGTGAGEVDFDGFKRAIQEKKMLADDLGTKVDSSPLRDPAKHDFRLKRGSAAVDGGAKVFVPWGLYAMVGEYHFRRNNADPSVVLDDHWYMADYVVRREDYRKCPVFNLKVENVAADDYEAGPLEDWTNGALTFDGEKRYAHLSHAEMTKAYTYQAHKGTRTASGSQIACADMARTNMLLELYFKTKPGHTKGVVISKMGDAGYELSVNASGSVTLTLRANGAVAEATCGAKINDGQWHHVIAEVDRKASRATIYVDGAQSSEEGLALDAGASLSNSAALLVGKGKDGHHFAGSIEFLRICRGTLQDASTTIEELYDWQFDGPFLRDFAGRDVAGERRDAGALEFTGN